MLVAVWFALLTAGSVIPAEDAGTPSLGILRSSESAAHFKAAWGNDVALDEELGFWERLAARQKISYRIFGDQELRRGVAPYEAVVLPFPDVDDATRWDNLVGVLHSSRRVLVIGDRFGEGGRFLDRIQSVCAIGTARPLMEKMGRYVAMKGRSFLSPDMQPAYRMEVEGDAPMFLASGSESSGLGWWVQWALTPYATNAAYDSGTALLYGRCGDAELLWIGFPVSALVQSKRHAEQDALFVRNVSAWLTGRPLVGKVPWKDDREVAVVVEADVEDQFENAMEFASILKKERVRGSFFLLGQEAEKNPEVVKALAEVGEIGSHSMGHEDFSKKTADEQRKELEETVALMHKLGVANVIGFRPPYEGINEETLKVLAASGLKLLYGMDDFTCSYPSGFWTGTQWFYQFPRIVRDDYNIVEQKKAEDPVTYLLAFREDLAMMRRFGGFFPLSVHTNFLMKPSSIKALAPFLEDVKQPWAWLTTLTEIVDFVEQRRAVKVTCDASVCRIRNESAQAIRGFPLAAYRVTSNVNESSGGRVAAVPRGDGGLTLVVDLEAGQEVVLPLR